ncbi:lysosomal amino acid transporter 1 homolog isoform 1-T3 [Discoglossus pictus]
MDGQVTHWRYGTFLPPANFSDCPNGSEWIWNVLQECADEGRDVASVYLGLFSILCFVVSSLPQYYRSWKTGNMDRAISIWFLLGWLGGDSCNFVGAFLSHQLPLQTYTAVYYVLADILMLSMYIYYKFRNQEYSAYTPINAVGGVALFGSLAAFSFLREPPLAVSDPGAVLTSRRLLSVDNSGYEPFTTQDIIGFTIGSVSSVMYLLSRVPQIFTNFRRRSTEGLALSLFSLIVIGNLTYGLSVLLKKPDKGQCEGNYIVHHLPWLIGSLGVMTLDFIIILQFIIFRKNSLDPSAGAETEPLVSDHKRGAGI